MSSRLVAHSCQRKGKSEWSMCSVAADVLTAMLTALLLALLANPEAQRNAQAEIDKVVVSGHLPDFGEETMPYVSVLVEELIRWWTVTPL
ncbi:hypothetical protein B0H17DRAFT_1108606, partial [Mycena rosella]